MFVVDLRLPPDDLACQMGDMRVWLDRHRVETSSFFYEEGIHFGVARLAFSVKREAEAFAEQFADRVAPNALITLAIVKTGQVLAA